MSKFKIDIEKSINATLFILKNLGGTCDFHKVFKILYFSDQKHIARYGRPVTGDWYVAMRNGPVPSNIYDILKAIKSDSLFNGSAKYYQEFFQAKSHYVNAKKEPDLDFLSETDIEVLNESLQENKGLNFAQLTNKSHDSAYENAQPDDAISFRHMAIAGGANEAILKYIDTNIENQRL